MGISLDSRLINPEEEPYKTMLEKLQGNILKGHGRDHSFHLFLEFNEDARGVGTYLAKLVDDGLITSAYKQHEQSKKHQENEKEMFGNLFLTAEGYRKLGFEPEQLPEATNYFLGGMKSKGTINALNDPPLSTWEGKYRDGQIHAMILLANADEKLLKQKVQDLETELKKFLRVRAVERGKVLRNAGGQPVEHFGYVDGISQPIFLATDSGLREDRDKWDPAAPLSLVLVRDTLAEEDDCFGSYLVFRKLEQDVRGFKIGRAELAGALELTVSDWHDLQAANSETAEEVRAEVKRRAIAPKLKEYEVVKQFLARGRTEESNWDDFQAGNEKAAKRAAALKLTELDWQRAGAMIVGRFEDGTPLAALPFPPPRRAAMASPLAGEPPENNFIYDEDKGLKCPIFAHTRATNPRNNKTEQFPLIARRGVPYGERDSLEKLPEKAVGLLFMCFQRNIDDQFAFIQRQANKNHDPIIGQSLEAPQFHREWPVQWGRKSKSLPFDTRWVRLKGGEFFFAPSIPFLRTKLKGR